MKQEDIEDLKELIEFLKEHQVAEFEVDRDGLKVRLKFSQPEGSSASLSDARWNMTCSYVLDVSRR